LVFHTGKSFFTVCRFEGNSKKEMYEQLPKWCLPETLYIENTTTLDEVKTELKKVHLNFPIIAKPDRGMQGVLFRVIKDETDLQQYHGSDW
jgi:glutathione synthase/RimK-type ligase-like ATP-grasp enzyme